MIFHTSRILKAATDEGSARSDMLKSMSAKISKRLIKSKSPLCGNWIRIVQDTVAQTHRTLEYRWHVIQEAADPSINLDSLSSLDFESDQFVVLPDVDQFVSSISERLECSRSKQQPPLNNYLQDFPAADLPQLTSVADESYAAFNLAAFETWVAFHLDTWIKKHPGDSATYQLLSNLIRQYHAAAKSRYESRPMDLSRMILVILELWTACDKASLAAIPLLAEYKPEIPAQVFSSLLLPFMNDMIRLGKVERYLEERARASNSRVPSVFRSFGEALSFSVRYFQQSDELKRLHDSIVEKARRDREAKVEELRRKKSRYEELMRLYSQTSHEYVVVQANRGFQERHSWHCPCCKYRQDAENLSISVLEWPLPSRILEAYSTVFEMKLPESFRYWRDLTHFVNEEVLLCKPTETGQPNDTYYPLISYSGLALFGQFSQNLQSVQLVSDTKPHVVTHRRDQDVGSATESTVCLNNGLRWKYWAANCHPLSPYNPARKFSESCTLQLAAESQALSPFLMLCHSRVTGEPLNAVLASLCDCPPHLSLDEFKALASVPLGYRLPWLNILVQLAAGKIDFNKTESAIFMLKTVLQAGPAGNGIIRREAHNIVGEAKFVTTILSELRKAIRRIETSWESLTALWVLTFLTSRVLSLAPWAAQQSFLDTLTLCRQTSFKWTRELRAKTSGDAGCALNAQQRADLLGRTLDVTLVCLASFDVDTEHLDVIFSQPDTASSFIECCIVAQENKSFQANSDLLEPIMLARRTRIIHRARPVLEKQILDQSSDCLDDAIKRCWSAYSGIKGWRSHCSASYWLLNRSSDSDVSFNLLTSELLVNGIPLSQLPHCYRKCISYTNLFGKMSIEVRPITFPGMQFSSAQQFGGYTVYFGMKAVPEQSGSTSDLLLHTVKDNSAFDLVPSRLFFGVLPDHFSGGFLHWYSQESQEIEFRPLDSAWRASDRNPRLIRDGTRWKLRCDDNVNLIDPSSPASICLSNIFARLETRLKLHIFYDTDKRSVEITIPRLHLSFDLQSGESSLQSRQYRGMQVDPEQAIGTLVGCTEKLVLHSCQDTSSRMVLIPDGSVNIQKNLTGSHIFVSIDVGSASGTQAYSVNKRLACLTDEGTLYSKLFLAYLHAVTSFVLPDPLTGHTGTEKALEILRSAGTRSNNRLNDDEASLCQIIAELSPRREFYPKHEMVMQTVIWSKELSFLSQSGHFYLEIRDFFAQVEKTSFLYPEVLCKPHQLQGFDEDLLQRELIRSSSLCVAGWGAEDFTASHDRTYKSRDNCQMSFRARNAANMARQVCSSRHCLPYSTPADLSQALYDLLAKANHTRNDKVALRSEMMHYEASWLQDPSPILSEHACQIHCAYNANPTWLNIYETMMWLTTTAYANNNHRGATLALFAIALDPKCRSRAAKLPRNSTLHLGRGVKFKADEIETAVYQATKDIELCPEKDVIQRAGETFQEMMNRKERTYETNKDKAVQAFVQVMKRQWPCAHPAQPNDLIIRQYIALEDAMKKVVTLFDIWYANLAFKSYLDQLVSSIQDMVVRPTSAPSFDLTAVLAEKEPRGPTHVSEDEVFAENDAPIDLADSPDNLMGLVQSQGRDLYEYERQYVADLKRSLTCLKIHTPELVLPLGESLKSTLEDHLQQCTAHLKNIQLKLANATNGHHGGGSDSTISITRLVAAQARMWPRLSSSRFLEKLNRVQWSKLPPPWKKAIVSYGLSVTELQRAERLCKHLCRNNKNDLIKELLNVGHENWDLFERPEILLLEAESGITIRDVQTQIAHQIMSPPGRFNSVMQLNMGEGKSSVIVPAAASTLADGTQVVRIIVAKPQATQMFSMLVSKLGGLLNRRIYRMPFSRGTRPSLDDVKILQSMIKECQFHGGVMLVQPEHLLSFQLMGPECLSTGTDQIGQELLNTQRYFDGYSRDIVDESDENFSVKLELIYTMGEQKQIEHSPSRWSIIQNVLDLVQRFSPQVKSLLKDSIEILDRNPGQFRRIRILRQDAQDLLLDSITKHIYETGFIGFTVAHVPTLARLAIKRYITNAKISDDRSCAEKSMALDGVTVNLTLLLLRGLLAGGVLAHALKQKRWRVNYGIDSARQPATCLAVPYRAKDVPSSRSEFSHPDVVIVLTCLSYYYGGLEDNALFDTFNQLVRADRADDEYQAWVSTAPQLPVCFHHLSSVNLRDRMQCINEIFPHLRFSKGAIDYYLAHLVFPREMKEFPKKLSSSGWDLGKPKKKPTTGFSGTIDSRHVLPFSVKHLDLPGQEHTNALVLAYLPQSENDVAMLPPLSCADQSDGKALVKMIMSMERETRVILDVGAQVVDLSNLDMAKAWLNLAGKIGVTEAVVFFDDDDELSVVGRTGRVERLQASPFQKSLELCLVFLDEAHTRGTDLRLPHYYRAAVTLGAQLKKDTLVQACMRMRKLGKGQSVVFCVSEEIKNEIQNQRHGVSSSTPISVADVLAFALREMCDSLRRDVPLWATQGMRYARQRSSWEQVADKNFKAMDRAWAESFLEDEAQSMEHRYRPRVLEDPGPVVSTGSGVIGEHIRERLAQFSITSLGGSSLQEEQERELSPEVEEERQIERPPKAEPAQHHVHPTVQAFVRTGKLDSTASGVKSASDILADTTAAQYPGVDEFPRDLLVTEDFARTIKITYNNGFRSDAYQRPVQWVMMSTSQPNQITHVLIVSPYEAQELLPEVYRFDAVSLHLYSPRINSGFESLDHLNLYTMPPRESKPKISIRQRTLLNLFSGQLYLCTKEEYISVCDMLGLAWHSADGRDTCADGFIVPGPGSDNKSTFTKSPVSFLKVLLTKIRRECDNIDMTHMGKILNGVVLTDEDFDQDCSRIV